MAQQKHDGGQAFPYSHESERQGMTLRDYFAGQAMAGMLANHKSQAGIAVYSKDAYDVADAMIAARDA